jgi:hypothetical protein
MSKDTINIKSNGIRNELKEIRKSIDNLTNAIIAQTDTHNEKSNYNIDWKYVSDSLRCYPTENNQVEKKSV